MKKKTRLVSLLLAAVMLMALLPAAALAEGESDPLPKASGRPAFIVESINIYEYGSLMPGMKLYDIGIAGVDFKFDEIDKYEGCWYVIEGDNLIQITPDSNAVFEVGKEYVQGFSFEGLRDLYCKYIFDETTKVTVGGQSVTPFRLEDEDTYQPNFRTSFAMIDPIDISHLVVFYYVGECKEPCFTLSGYEYGAPASGIKVEDHHPKYFFPDDISKPYCILTEKDGIPDITTPFSGNFAANTNYWLAIALDYPKYEMLLSDLDGNDDDSSSQEFEDWKNYYENCYSDWKSEAEYEKIKLENGSQDALLLYENGALALFKLNPLTAPAAPVVPDHEFNHWGMDEYGHWPVCYCGLILGLSAPHAYGDDNICDVCGYAVIVPETPELPQTGSSATTALTVMIAGAAALLIAFVVIRKKRA